MTPIGLFFAYWTIGLILARRHALDLAADLHILGPAAALSKIMRVSLTWPTWVLSGR